MNEINVVSGAKLPQIDWFLIYSTVLTLVFGLLLSRHLFIVLSVWTVLVYLAIHALKDRRLSGLIDPGWIYGIGVGYPLAEFVLKVMIETNIVPGSWFWINRVEHGVFSAVVTFLLFFVIRKWLPQSNKWQELFISVLLLNLFGVFNEFLEFGARIIGEMNVRGFYQDTMFDLITNLVVASVVAVGMGLVYRKVK